MILVIAGTRPIYSDVIDGNDQSQRLAVQVRIQRNTLEQLVLMALAHLCLATLLEPENLKILPVLTTLFVVSRVLYWIGYSIHPTLRSFGFVATFYPNIAALVWAAWLTTT
jgi:uncharacterized MAPEG superfamily protein